LIADELAMAGGPLGSPQEIATSEVYK